MYDATSIEVLITDLEKAIGSAPIKSSTFIGALPQLLPQADDVQFWKDRIAACRSAPFPTIEGHDNGAVTASVIVSISLQDAKAKARRLGHTLATLALVVSAQMIGEAQNSSNVAIGRVVSLRGHLDHASDTTLGLMLNTVPAVFDLSQWSRQTAHEVISAAGAQLLKDGEHDRAALRDVAPKGFIHALFDYQEHADSRSSSVIQLDSGDEDADARVDTSDLQVSREGLSETGAALTFSTVPTQHRGQG